MGNERVSISLGKPATRFGRPSMGGGQGFRNRASSIRIDQVGSARPVDIRMSAAATHVFWTDGHKALSRPWLRCCFIYASNQFTAFESARL